MYDGALDHPFFHNHVVPRHDRAFGPTKGLHRGAPPFFHKYVVPRHDRAFGPTKGLHGGAPPFFTNTLSQGMMAFKPRKGLHKGPPPFSQTRCPKA